MSKRSGYCKMSLWVCIREARSGLVKRLKRLEAASMVSKGLASYVSRSAWKSEVRDIGKNLEVTDVDKKSVQRNPKGKARKNKS